MWVSFARPLRLAARCRASRASRHRWPTCGPVALPRAAAGRCGSQRSEPWRRDDAVAANAEAGRGARSAEAADEGRRPDPDGDVQGTRRGGGCVARRRTRRHRDRHADQRQCRGGVVCLRGQGGPAAPHRDARRGTEDHPRGVTLSTASSATRASSSPAPSRSERVIKTSPRSGSPTGSRGRRRWAWKSPSSSAGGCPT